MKLYYSPGVCSLAPHIVAKEAGVSLEMINVDTATQQLADGSDYLAINSRGQVPVLELDDGDRLTEGAIIAQFIADKAQARTLMPTPGSVLRYRVMEWQNYVSSEMHKSYAPLFNPEIPAPVKAEFSSQLRKKYQWLNQRLSNNQYLTGEDFTAADAYLFTVTTWADSVGLELSGLDHITRFQADVAARSAVQSALKYEGLLN